MNRLQEVDLEIIKEVIKVCNEHNLVYYLVHGTLLGAVRHRGFIPWDDDIDLGMPREDYERFLEIAPKELPDYLGVVNYRTDPQYHYYITRIRHTRTVVEEVRIGNDDKYTNASIDIFPLDGAPNFSPARKLYFFRIMFHRAMMSLCYKDSIDRARKRGAVERAFLWVLERLPVEKIFDPYKEKCTIDRLMRKHTVEKSNYIGCLMGGYRTREIVPKSYFGQGALYPFETLRLRGPQLYDAYLKHMYGNYDKLPAKENQKVHFRLIEIKGKDASGCEKPLKQ